MNELERLKKIADKQRREKAKIEGKIESLVETLAEEGWDSVSEAKKDMDVLGRKIAKMRRTFEEKLNRFKKKYAKELS